MLELYLAHLKDYGKGKSTITNHKSQISQFLKWINIDPTQVTTDDIEKYVEYTKTYKSPSSSNTIISTLISFFSWMKDEGYVLTNPASNVKKLKLKFIPKWLTKSQKVRLIQTVKETGNKRNICVIYLMLMAGLKAVEVCNLKHEDVVLGEREGIVVVKGSRKVTIPKELHKALGDYIYERPVGEWLFDTQESDQLTYGAIQVMCYTLGKKAKIPRLNARMLRHTYGFDLAEKKVPINVIAQQMGYERLEEALRYFMGL